MGSWHREEQVGTSRKQDRAWPAASLTPPRWLINGRHRPELEEDDSVNGTRWAQGAGSLLSSQFSVNLKLS